LPSQFELLQEPQKNEGGAEAPEIAVTDGQVPGAAGVTRLDGSAAEANDLASHTPRPLKMAAQATSADAHAAQSTVLQRGEPIVVNSTLLRPAVSCRSQQPGIQDAQLVSRLSALPHL
jgi:hypothetical protein